MDNAMLGESEVKVLCVEKAPETFPEDALGEVMTLNAMSMGNEVLQKG